MPDYLGNKANPVLAGLTGLGEGLFQGYLARQQYNQEQQKLDFQERRLSMLDMINQKQWEAEFNQRQQYQDAQIDNMNADNERLSKEKPVIDLYEDMGTTEVEGKPMLMKRNKATNKMEYFPAYREPDKPKEVDPLIAELRQQRIDDANEKKQANLEKSIADTDLWIAKTKGGLQTVGDKIKKSGYIGVGENNKPTFLEKNEWRAKARGSVNTTVSKLGMQSDITSLWVGAKQAAKKKYGKDLDSVDATEKRKFLKSIVDNSEVPDTQKKVLYQYIEVYTR